jgi:hypothetical protein
MLLLLCFSAIVHAQSSRIFSSLDHGKTWVPSDFGFPPTATVNDFVVADNIVLAGTEKHSVFISTNRARSWRQLTHTLPANLKINATAFLNGAWFLGAPQHGIYKSTNLTHWSRANSGLSNISIRRLLASNTHLYAATDAGLFLSENSAITWQYLHGTSQVTGIAVYHTSIFYSDIHGILRSTDLGKSFQRVYSDGTPHNLTSTADALFATIYGVGLKRSDNNGQTWLKSDSGLPTGQSYTFQIRPIDDLLFASQWDGIYISRNQGQSWVPSSSGLTSSAITDIIQLDDETILAAAGLLKE